MSVLSKKVSNYLNLHMHLNIEVFDPYYYYYLVPHKITCGYNSMVVSFKNTFYLKFFIIDVFQKNPV